MYITNSKVRVVNNFKALVNGGIPATVARTLVTKVQHLMIQSVHFADNKVVLAYSDEDGNVDAYRFVMAA